ILDYTDLIELYESFKYKNLNTNPSLQVILDYRQHELATIKTELIAVNSKNALANLYSWISQLQTVDRNISLLNDQFHPDFNIDLSHEEISLYNFEQLSLRLIE